MVCPHSVAFNPLQRLMEVATAGLGNSEHYLVHVCHCPRIVVIRGRIATNNSAVHRSPSVPLRVTTEYCHLAPRCYTEELCKVAFSPGLRV